MKVFMIIWNQATKIYFKLSGRICFHYVNIKVKFKLLIKMKYLMKIKIFYKSNKPRKKEKNLKIICLSKKVIILLTIFYKIINKVNSFILVKIFLKVQRIRIYLNLILNNLKFKKTLA